MTRHFLAFAAFALCAFAGVGKSRIVKKRCELLEELVRTLGAFEIRIGCTAPQLAELISGDSSLFCGLVRAENSGNIRKAWAAACAKLEALPYCGKEEAALLRQLGMALGKSDRAGEVSLIKMYKQELNALYESAQEELAKKGGLFRSVGALCGIGAAIMIW